jgi:hypothetical protein
VRRLRRIAERLGQLAMSRWLPAGRSRYTSPRMRSSSASARALPAGASKHAKDQGGAELAGRADRVMRAPITKVSVSWRVQELCG